MAQHNSFIDGIGLTETNSLIHLLDNIDTDDNNEAPICCIVDRDNKKSMQLDSIMFNSISKSNTKKQ